MLRASAWERLFAFPLAGRGNVYHPHFAADGRDLIAASMPNHAQVWDWVAIRRTLRELGLDWDPGRSIPERESDGGHAPLRLVLPE